MFFRRFPEVSSGNSWVSGGSRRRERCRINRRKGADMKKGKAELKTNRGRKRQAALLACLVMAMMCGGCGSAGMMDDGDFQVGSSTMSSGESHKNDSSASGMGGGMYDSSESMDGSLEDMGLWDGRKLITTVNLDVETREFEDSMSLLESQVRSAGGYIENMTAYNGSKYSGVQGSRHSDLTVRIPKAALEDFLAAVSDVSNVVRQSRQMEDVTLSYVDMESRRNTLRTEQSRLLEFLDRAESIEEIITIEERLSNVRYQLESMESQLRTMDNRVEYATVYLYISEVTELTPVAEPSILERIGQGFTRNLKSIRDGATDLMVWLLVNSPYILIWAALSGIVLLLLWLRRRSNRKKPPKETKMSPPAMPGANPSGGGYGILPEMPENFSGGEKKDISKNES